MTFITHNLPNEAASEVVETAARPPAEGWWRLLHGPRNQICIGVVAVYVLIALASLVPVPSAVRSIPGLHRWYSFDQLIDFQFNAEQTYAPPALRCTDSNGVSRVSPAAWFGLDIQGRSVFWRTMYGTRTALLITVIASALSLSIGTVLGITAGYFAGWVDDLITWVYSVINSIPWLLLVIAVSYTLKQNAALSGHVEVDSGFLPRDLVIVILALGLTDWVSLCRLIRGEVIKMRGLDFVTAGRAMGLTEARILFRHILPNVSHLIIITFTLGAVGYLQVEVVLAFLGLGVSSQPSWGRMIDDAKLSLLRGVWWEVTAATVAIFIICLALTYLGDALRDALDPKLRGKD